MNFWTQLSIEFASQKDYLDKLFSVYPTIPESKREIDPTVWEKVEAAFNSTDNIALLNALFELDLFPVKDSYIAYLKRDPTSLSRNPATVSRICDRLREMGLNQILKNSTEPKETNRQIGPLFRNWLELGSFGIPLQSLTDFVNNNNNAILDANDQEMMQFATEQNGYFCGTQGVVRYTTDGGTNWSTPGTLPAGSYYGIGVIPGSSTAYICGVGKVIKTTNNGASWSDVSSGLTGMTFYAAAFTSNQVGVVVGKDSVIYKTTNGGTSWSQKTSNTGSTLYTVKFYDSEHGIAAGGSGDIILTADGGESWSRAEEISESTIRALTILNGTTAIFAGDKGTLLLSEDLPLPVELVEFTAVYTGGSVRINWKTATEKDNNGFEVQRIRPGMGGSGNNRCRRA
ncbi:MAG: hypothetical protein LC102_06190 [Ignavibacteriales bacterium]|nr:hypothetical protein [Ignavibacteriales bacterium]